MRMKKKIVLDDCFSFDMWKMDKNAITIVKDMSYAGGSGLHSWQNNVTWDLIGMEQTCGSRFGNKEVICEQNERNAYNAEILNS